MTDRANPFLQPSTLPYHLPPFALIRDEHYEPAFQAGMDAQLEEIRGITRQTVAPTFGNTLVPLEQSGQLLDRVSHVFWNKCSADSSDVTNDLEERIAPQLAAHRDAIVLDPDLFTRIAAMHQGLGASDLTASDLTDEQKYLVQRWHTEMTLAGAGLADTDKEYLKELNQRIAALTTRFEKNLLADTNALAVVVDDVAQLTGLGEGEISATAEAAKERGLDGQYLITLPLPTGHPFLDSLQSRELRQQIMWNSRERGSHGGEHDNRDLVLEIVRLRAQRAQLLGFPSHSAAVLADETAKDPQAVADLMGRLAPSAAANARAEQAKLEALAGFPIEASDWGFYTEKVRAAEYDVDTAALRPWFEAERVLTDGVFFAATKLYGIQFTERPDLVGYHPDVRVFEVKEADGSPVGLFLYDLYTRDSKRGGAWMNELYAQFSLMPDHDYPIVVNNHNVPKPAPGEPTLLTFDEVGTLFHEFGHALHGLFARVTYPKFTGTSVYRDFVEFPSQVNEMWMLWPEVLENYAKHYQTGEPLDAGIVARIRESEQFNQGFKTSEYLAAAMLDQAWHTLSVDAANAVTDVNAFEAQALHSFGLDNPAVPSRYQTPYFQHIFSSGYDAGYYSYIWSEQLDADTVEWFKENGGLTRANGDRFRALVLGIGGSRDPLEAYREFRGRDAELAPLLTRRGLIAAG